jgi:DNA-binding NtrC family response regulator
LPEAGSIVRGEETILVVEDHDDLRAYSTGVLRELGYHVLVAHDAQAGLTLLERESGVSLLFTDMVLPGGIDGQQLAEEAQRRRPGLRVLFTTGYTGNAMVREGRLDRLVDLISKPFTAQALGVRVREVLDRAEAGTPVVRQA